MRRNVLQVHYAGHRYTLDRSPATVHAAAALVDAGRPLAAARRLLGNDGYAAFTSRHRSMSELNEFGIAACLAVLSGR